MRGAVGDRIVTRSNRVGTPDRSGIILAVEGTGGQPPFLVRWDDGHEALVFPGSDAMIEHLPAVS